MHRLIPLAIALLLPWSLVEGAPAGPKSSPPPAPAPSVSLTPSSAIENSVVKIFATLRQPDPTKPWTKREPTEISGTGTVIAGNRILTNAHMVLYASEVQIQANQAADKISAHVEAIADGIDLAVLKLDDESFFKTHPALPFKKGLPDSREPVLVYGYPTGGSSLSITKGIVSRIEFTSYSLTIPGLRIQIDAAINPGNSGGPAVFDDQVVGIAFSHLQSAQNIGYIIPIEEVELFLQDISDGHYDGKPVMYDDLQTLENPALRAFLHLPESVRGIIVHRPFRTDAAYPLKEWDVITKIGDVPVDDQGMIKVSDNLRLHFRYLIQKLARNDRVPLTIFRNGKEMAIELPLLHELPVVTPPLRGTYPSYFIYGPLVFSEASAELIGSLPRANAAGFSAALALDGSPLITRLFDRPAFPGERLVVIPSPFFPHPLAKGYGNPSFQVVKAVNNHPVKNLADLVATLRNLKEESVAFSFDARYRGETMVFPRAGMVNATEGILTDAGIRAQGSPDMMKIWDAKSAP
ncbi:MAG: serine protease [Verrucomicrobiota bacterium]|nr:serine protease [Verrucomicrobiota bacterium]